MPIYLDVQGAQSRDSGHRGIGRYVLELAAAVERSRHADVVGGYVVNPDLPVPPALSAAVPAGRLVSSAELELAPGDVFHLTSPFEEVPFDRVWPPAARAEHVGLVVTVYDLIPLLYPDHYLADPAYHARYKNRIELIRLADRVFAISQATGADLVRILDLPPEDVTVTGTGVSARFAPPAPGADPLAAVTARLPAVRDGYQLYTGALDFRKNVDALLVAYSRLPRALRARHQLVIVSRLTAPELDALRPRLRALGIEHDVVVASAVEDDDLVTLYQAARLFVFPSLYEGFGLPVAEAIACGTPTIASDVASLVEILEDPAQRFDPADPESLRAVLERELTRPRDAEREPVALAARHTWPAVVERMVEAGESLGGRLPERGARRAAAIASLVAGEDIPWLAPAGQEIGAGRRVVRGALWPLRRFFDPRFAGVDTHVTTMHADLSARMDRAFGPWGSQSLADIERALARLGDRVGGPAEDAERGARTVEAAHALLALGRLPAGARVLDASTPPSGLAASLGALGYDVTLVAALSPADGGFDAVVALGATAAVRDLARFARPGGTLAVTLDADAAGHLPAILGTVEEVETRVLERAREGVWEPADPLTARSGERVALVTALRPAPLPERQAQPPLGAVRASDA
jgi:glycosyltransferase involved in cell wall biosynthesis